jgi:hypothetical protein
VNQRIGKISIAVISAALLCGCAPTTYQTNATDTHLAAYAGQANYPTQLTATQTPHMFCTVAPDATITIYNAGDESCSNFELWVNQLYTLHIEKMDARSTLALDPGTIYNKTGVNLKGVPATSINMVQIVLDGKLLDVQGPIVPH